MERRSKDHPAHLSRPVGSQPVMVCTQCAMVGAFADRDPRTDCVFHYLKPGGKYTAGAISQLAHDRRIGYFVIHSAPDWNALRSDARRFWTPPPLYRDRRSAGDVKHAVAGKCRQPGDFCGRACAPTAWEEHPGPRLSEPDAGSCARKGPRETGGLRGGAVPFRECGG